MTERLIFGVLLGATIGFGVGMLGARAGGACPIMCNPYIACVFGALMGALLANAARPPAQFTPSPYLLTIESRAAFERDVLQSDKPVLVEFYAPGCRF